MHFGPTISPVMIVHAAPNEAEVERNEPYQDLTGWTFSKLAKEAGLELHNCLTVYITNEPKALFSAQEYTTKKSKIDKEKFPRQIAGAFTSETLYQDIQQLQELVQVSNPAVILAVGDLPLLALCGTTEVGKWRGSELTVSIGSWSGIVVPIYDAHSIIKNWPLRELTKHDIEKRVVRKLKSGWAKPEYKFRVGMDDADEIINYLRAIPDGAWVSCDAETVQSRVMDCFGFATSPTEAICIPLFHRNGESYWDTKPFLRIIDEIRRTLNRVRVIGQNFNYDAQYLYRCHDIWSVAEWDTLSAQHVLFPGTPKSLDHLASLYCHSYEYWKDENKNWSGKEKIDDNQRWIYNCKDCCYTFEVAMEQMKLIEGMGFRRQYEIQRRTDLACFKTMLRGLNVNKDMKHELHHETKEAIKIREARLNELAGYDVNPRSPVQVKAMFKALNIKLPTKMGKASTDKECLEKLLDKEGPAKEVAALLLEIRSLGTIKSNVIDAPLDDDGKFHTSLNGCGAETFRLSSSKSAFMTGGNAQNITDGSRAHTDMPVPNLRRLYVPPPGYTIWECDQQRADVQVVAWEAGDEEMKAMFREGADLHTENAKALFGLREAPTKQQRDKGKTFVHLTDYGGKARTCAIKCGMTVHEADKAQKRWFEIHPGIKKWHERTEESLRREHCVYNAFGFRRYYFDRVEGLLGQALAWVPQSTVAIVDNMAWNNIEELDLEELQVLLQVHDSLVGIYETFKEGILLPLIHNAFSSVVVPYDDPLVIGVDIKTSVVSWGDCKHKEWENATST